jgi:hypothetical protein
MVAALKAPLPGPSEALQFGAMANLPGVAMVGLSPSSAMAVASATSAASSALAAP